MKILATATEKQLAYIDRLLERHDEAGTLEDVIAEINPDLGEEEEFMRWAARQSVRRASEVIDILKENLSDYR
jgi:hypothetical protein